MCVPLLSESIYCKSSCVSLCDLYVYLVLVCGPGVCVRPTRIRISIGVFAMVDNAVHSAKLQSLSIHCQPGVVCG